MNDDNKDLEEVKHTNNNKGLKIALIVVSVALILLVGYLVGSKSAKNESSEKIDKSEVIKKEAKKSKTENVEFKYDHTEATMTINDEETYYVDVTDNVERIEKKEQYTSSIKDTNNNIISNFERNYTTSNDTLYEKFFDNFYKNKGLDAYMGEHMNIEDIEYFNVNNKETNEDNIYFNTQIFVNDEPQITMLKKHNDEYIYFDLASSTEDTMNIKSIKDTDDKNAITIAKLELIDENDSLNNFKIRLDILSDVENLNLIEFIYVYFISEGLHSKIIDNSSEEISKSDGSSNDFDFSSVKFDDNFIRISNNQTNFYASDTLMYQVQMLKDKIYPQRYYVKNGRDSGLVSAEFIKNPVEHFMNLVKDDGSSLRYDEVVINTDDYDKIRIYKDSVVNEHIIITLKNGELLATVNASLDLKEDIRLKTSKLTFRTKDFENAIKNQDVTQVYNPSASIDSPFIHVEKDPSITNLGMDKYLEDADTFVLFNEDKSDSYSIIMNQINVDDDYINTAVATLVAIDQQFIFKDIEYNK